MPAAPASRTGAMFARAIAVAVALLLIARPATAQLGVSADVALNSQFVWRGVTSTNRPVIQPEVLLSAPIGGLTATVGAWGNVEPVRYDGPRELSSLGGLPGPLITQSQFWAELSGSRGRTSSTVGAQTYLYPHVGDLAEFSTVELYATVGVDAPISPSVTVSYDVARIRGAYVEGALTRDLTSERHGGVSLGVTGGYSAGQAVDPRERDLAYFAREGFTHLDVAANASLAVGPVAVAPELHVIVARDAWAMTTAPDVSRRVKLWFGTTLSWSSAGER